MRISRFLLLLVTVLPLAAAEPEYPGKGPDIYDTQADGTQAIETALQAARAGQKHVLLQLGANWCIWCRRLHDTLQKHAGVADLLQRKFVVVPVDVNQRPGKKRNVAVNERYGNPIQHGLPVLLVLDADGQLLTTQETGALENGADGHDPDKIIAFLRRWAPAD
jgi:thioredoxin-related protein